MFDRILTGNGKESSLWTMLHFKIPKRTHRWWYSKRPTYLKNICISIQARTTPYSLVTVHSRRWNYWRLLIQNEELPDHPWMFTPQVSPGILRYQVSVVIDLASTETSSVPIHVHLDIPVPATHSSQRSLEFCLPPVRLLHVRRHGYLPSAGVHRWFHQLRLARLPVLDQQGDSDSSWRATAATCFYPLGGRPLRLVPVVLEPDLHLGGRQPNDRGQVLPFRGAKVPLLAETSLQLERLRLGEQHSPLPLLVLGLVGLRLGRLLVVLELGRLFLLALVAALLLRGERQVRDRWAGRVWLLEHCNGWKSTGLAEGAESW